jgi:hypothetical protein
MARNPFRMRASARAVNDEQFVKTFAASAIDILREPDEPWTGLVYVRSAPGGGKTSLLRLLTPGPLRRAMALADDARYRPIREALQDAGVISNDHALLWGVLLTFTNDYRTLDDLGSRALAVFRALTSARIVLATLRALLERAERVFPDDLAIVQAKWTPVDGAMLPATASGQELQSWASEIEDGVFNIMDELGEDEGRSARGLSVLDGLHWLADATFTINGRPVTARPVLLLDDLHSLSLAQHSYFNEALTSFRKPLSIWVAERLEALRSNDLLSIGVREGRDYQKEIRLEQRWIKRGPGPYGRFLSQIADLRARQADGFEERDFFPALAEERDHTIWDAKFEEAQRSIEHRLGASVGKVPRYEDWLKARTQVHGPAQQRAVDWRALEILITRDQRQEQKAFEFQKLTEGELDAKDRSNVQEAAELFLCREIGAPYSFGKERLAALSSSNVDQFVELAGDLFEEILSASVVRRGAHSLSADRQQAILKDAAERRWIQAPRGAARGHAVLRFLDRLGDLCTDETFKPTAPYAPGVTGIGISMAERDALLAKSSDDAKSARLLREVLASCIAQNLLEPRIDHKNKGERWLVLYLNRLLCVRFGLPLSYGGWRPRKVTQLAKWLDGASIDAELPLA